MSDSLEVRQSSGYSRLAALHASADAIPLLVDETYHLFHLTTPPNTTHHPARLRSFWTRMRSTDLKKWMRDAKPVITPSKNASAPDADGAWTGSAVIGPDNAMHIFYTGYNLSQAGRQVILHARSLDQHGTSFTKNPSPVKITSPPTHRAAFEDIDFRDPFVFHHGGTSSYWMLVGTRLSNGPHWTRGCLALLTSRDLLTWSLDPAPFYAPNDLLCPECPELFALPNGKWYLVYSRFAAPHAGTVYRVADAARGPFRVPRDGCDGLLDGRRWFAAKSCAKRGELGKRVFFGWTGDWCESDGKWLWGGDLALPREVYADAEGLLKMRPVQEALDALLAPFLSLSPSVPSSLALSAFGTTRTHFLDLPHPFHNRPYLFSFSPIPSDIPNSTPSCFGILIRTFPSLRGHRIVFRPLHQHSVFYSVIVQTDMTPLDDFWADQYGLYVPRGVDGPECVRMDAVRLDQGDGGNEDGNGQREQENGNTNGNCKGIVRLLVQGDVLQCFVGGRALTFRLPPRRSLRSAAGAREEEERDQDRSDGSEAFGTAGAVRDGSDGSVGVVDGEPVDDGIDGRVDEDDGAGVKELGFFVQDGDVVFDQITLR